MPGTPPEPPLPPPTVFVAPNGDDAAPCARLAPCSSFARAYRVARPGEVVEVAGGTYPDQVLDHDPAKTGTARVTFVPAPGARPVLGMLRIGRQSHDLGARHVAIHGMVTGGFHARRAQDLVFRDVEMRGNFWTDGSDDVAIIGGSVGGTANGTHPDIQIWRGSDGGRDTSERILIDGVHFHDVRMRQAGDHVECLQVSDVRGLVIRNSRFGPNCDTFGLHVSQTADIIRDVVIENSVFERPTNSCGCQTAYYGLSVRDGVNVLLRNNTAVSSWTGPTGDLSGPTENWRIVGNLMPKDHCRTGYTQYRYNVWIAVATRPAGGCSPTDRYVQDARFLPGSAEPAAGSPAIEAADPNDFPPRDIRGRRRPGGALPDAGAYERQG